MHWWSRGPVRTVALTMGVAIVCVSAAFFLGRTSPAPKTDRNQVHPNGDRLVAQGSSGTSTSVNDAPPSDAPEVAIVGDSTALHIAFGFGGWTQETGLARSEGDVIELGCGLLPADLFTRFRYDGEASSPAACAAQEARRAESIHRTRPDIAVVIVGPWEVADWYDEELGRWRRIGQPDFDDIIKERIRLMIDTLSADGAAVFWLTSPRIQVGMRDGVPSTFHRPASNPLRMQRLNTLVAEVAAEYPDIVEILDLAGYLRTTPGGEMDPDLRPDGVHFTWDSANQLAEDWLGPEVLRWYAARQSEAAAADG